VCLNPPPPPNDQPHLTATAQNNPRHSQREKKKRGKVEERGVRRGNSTPQRTPNKIRNGCEGGEKRRCVSGRGAIPGSHSPASPPSPSLAITGQSPLPLNCGEARPITTTHTAREGGRQGEGTVPLSSHSHPRHFEKRSHHLCTLCWSSGWLCVSPPSGLCDTRQTLLSPSLLPIPRLGMTVPQMCWA